jgi:hypothetical protein
MSRPQQHLMQVCMNGHKITQHHGRSSSDDKDYCTQCGARTVVECKACRTKIPGCVHYPGVIGGCRDMEVPDFCQACGEPYPWTEQEERAFLAADFGKASVSKLSLSEPIRAVIEDRLLDADVALQANRPMPVIFSCGSAVEGMLFARAQNNPRLYNQAAAAPKNRNGDVKLLADWTLEELINASREVGHISDSAKKFAHSLKDYRNYIHPRQQVGSAFNPDIETAKVCYQVTKQIISNLEQSQNLN